MTTRTLPRTIAVFAAAIVAALPVPASAVPSGVNDYACRSSAQPTPVVLLHGLGASKDVDLNVLQANLARMGHCTFSLTYGEDAQNPFVGGRAPIADSNAEISGYIADVLARTGAAQVDIVGHSEGGFMSLYVTKFGGLDGRVRKVVAIAPPTHGTQFVANIAQLRDVAPFGRVFVERMAQAMTFPAVPELLPGGKAVGELETGPIAQPGVGYTIIQSRLDEMVTPVETAFVREAGVRNVFVQDFCPADPVGHIGEAYDPSVWRIVYNALDPATNALPSGPTCSAGLPF